MTLALEKIHELECKEDYPAAIDELEEYVRINPNSAEAVIRLGFNLWYAVEGADRMRKTLLREKYSARFMELFNTYRNILWNNSDFCHSFGLGLNLFYYYFVPDAKDIKVLKSYELLGKRLLRRARKIDPFWKTFCPEMGFWGRLLFRLSPKLYSKKKNKAEENKIYAEARIRLGGRGILAKYYNIA